MLSQLNQDVSEIRKSFKTKGSFTQNLAITFSGNVIAQILGFAFTPFIARIYGPEAYGVFALFVAIINNISPVSTLQLPSSYVAVNNDSEFYRLVKITLMVLLAGTALFLGVVFLFQYEIINQFRLKELTPFFFWMPVYFLLMGFDHILLGWNIRLKEFKRGAVAKMVSTVASRGVTVLLGILLQPSALGIIVGNLLTYPLESATKMSKTIRSEVSNVFKPSTWTELKSTFIKFRGYAFFVTPGLLITNLSSQLPVYYFSLTFNHATVGLFALANSMVNMPLSLVINSSTTVFLQKAAETLATSMDELRRMVKSLHQKLFLISFLPLAVLALVSDWIFRVIFGTAWEESGVYASILCISATFYVSFSPLSVLFRLMQRERLNFLITILFLPIKALGLWIGVYYNSIMVSVIGYSIASVLSYIFSLFIIFRMVKLSPWFLIKDVLLVIGLAVLVILFKL